MRGITVTPIAVHNPPLCCIGGCGDIPWEAAEVLQMCSKLLQGQMNAPQCTTGQKQSSCAAATWLATRPGARTLMKYDNIGN